MDYRTAGVDIEAGNRAVAMIKSHVARTHHAGVLSSLGGFAAPVALPSGYQEPVLVSCTDGVGTKLSVAIECQKLDTIGIDLVAMCVNDLVCMGAKPLFFLDYIACHRLEPDDMVALIKGMTEGCLGSDCALVGGEMAEMGDVYQPGHFDLAGFCVGVVEKSKMIDGSSVSVGDGVYASRSSGIHSNGFSLVRRVLTPSVCDAEGIEMASLLTPTRLYVRLVRDLLAQYRITALAHITGGGLAENVTRVLPEGCHVMIDASWDIPPVFHHIQRLGPVDLAEMRRVFNMGVGMVAISPDRLDHPDWFPIGRVVSGVKGVTWS